MPEQTTPNDKPNSPRLWEREGKFYAVRQDGNELVVREVLPDGNLNCGYYPSKFPGNWRKLEPGEGGLHPVVDSYEAMFDEVRDRLALRIAEVLNPLTGEPEVLNG